MPERRVPTFINTAEYFEARAQRMRDDDRRAELTDTARFYRSLGRITPYFPHGYRQPTPRRGNGERLNKRADECRAIAATIANPTCRAMLLRLAATYEQIAAGPALAAE